MSRARIYDERKQILTEIREDLDAIEIFHKLPSSTFIDIRSRLDLIERDYVGPLGDDDTEALTEKERADA